ncbi:DUF2784 family protein [Massilia psychrophila]|uniref:DUF2784 family protein n=1 Tax=Massilia psychrophila TaxID=1603353 RepID=UPI001E2A8938|nr:DUF2784 family protein [Massilia psychrophila]
MSHQSYLFLANAVLALHASVVLFIVAGLMLVLLGGRRKWQWVRNGTFRVLHLAAIGYVVMQSWLGIVCPLTDLEQWLRQRAGAPLHEGDFISFWLGKLLFYHAQPWVFIAVYSAFALAVVYSWVIVRPGRLKRRIGIDVAGSAGVGPVFVREVERGKETVQLGRVMQILAELGVELQAAVPDEVKETLSALKAKGVKPFTPRKKTAPAPKAVAGQEKQ